MQLGRSRFLVQGQRIDLCAGLAFGVLSVANATQLLGLLVSDGPFGVRGGATLVLLLYELAAVLLVLGLFGVDSVVPAGTRRELWWRLVAVLTATLVAIGVAAVSMGDAPVTLLIDTGARDALEAGKPIQDVLRGQSPWVLLVNGLSAGLLLVAALGYLRVGRRLEEPQVGWLAFALTFLFFGQAHALLFPPVAVEYVSSGDLCELVGFGVLLFSLVSRLGEEIAHRASRDERLRLSRELHDGLAQQLALLHIRLGESLGETCGSDVHARDLEFAARQVEGALLEARQAITALRAGPLAWEEFTGTLGSYVDEFADNHQVDVRLSITGSAPAVDAALQAEILRILHEAFSNALRHGGAQRIEVDLEAAQGWLQLRVEDDGRGLTASRPPSASSGLGLASMAERVQRRGGLLEVGAGTECGVAVQARLPLTGNA
jgi:signal transduction histidine kinase